MFTRSEKGKFGTTICLFNNWENWIGLLGTMIWEWKSKYGLGLLKTSILGIPLFSCLGLEFAIILVLGIGISTSPSGPSIKQISFCFMLRQTNASQPKFLVPNHTISDSFRIGSYPSCNRPLSLSLQLSVILDIMGVKSKSRRCF